MLTHAKIHMFVSQKKITPERAAEILVAQREARQASVGSSLFVKMSLFAIALVTSLFGIRSDRA